MTASAKKANGGVLRAQHSVSWAPNRAWTYIGIVAFAAVGTILLVGSHAATPTASFQAEAGTRTGNAAIVSDTSASGGSAVQFSSTAQSGTCPAFPSFPDENCTGWQHTGVTLTPYTGGNITTDGTVLDGKDITGCITILANNVTIKRSRILCDGGYWAVKQNDGYSGFTLTDTEIARPPGSTNNVDDLVSIFGGNATLTRNNVHNGSTGFQIAANNVTVQDNYVWDQKNTSGGDHVDALLDNGNTTGVTIRHNNFEVGINQTSPLALYDDSYTGGAEHNTIVDQNLFNGGGYCIYPGGATSTGIQVTNNHFGRKFFASCGYWNPVYSAGWNKSAGAGNVWSGNVWDDTGQAITP